jgi:hypothetical protein
VGIARLAWRIALATAALVIVACVLFTARGSRETIDLSAPGSRTAGPGAVCLSRKPRRDRKLLERCVRVRGYLLHVWREYDRHRQLDDVHLLISSRFRLYVVKVYPPFPRRLRFARELTAVGPLVQPHPEHLGIHEVEAFSLSGRAVR